MSRVDFFLKSFLRTDAMHKSFLDSDKEFTHLESDFDWCEIQSFCERTLV
jgi:hypothetical protein